MEAPSGRLVSKTLEIKHTYELEGAEYDVDFMIGHIQRVYAPSLPLLAGLCEAWNVKFTLDGEPYKVEE